jgi:nitroreductase
MVIHTMALAAVELGIGQCVIYGAIRALLKSPKLIARLQLPAGYNPLGALVLGVSDESYVKRDVSAHIRQNEV